MHHENPKMVKATKTITCLTTLFESAKELGEARKSGDPTRIAEAEKRHEAYRQLCLKSDEMITGYKYSDLF